MVREIHDQFNGCVPFIKCDEIFLDNFSSVENQ